MPVPVVVKVPTGVPTGWNSTTDWLESASVKAGVTVSVAGWLVALLATLVKTAWYSLLLSVALGVKVSVGVVALALPVMSVKVVPPLVLTCHCTVGVGVPLRCRGEGHRGSSGDGLAGRVGGDDGATAAVAGGSRPRWWRCWRRW